MTDLKKLTDVVDWSEFSNEVLGVVELSEVIEEYSSEDARLSEEWFKRTSRLHDVSWPLGNK